MSNTPVEEKKHLTQEEIDEIAMLPPLTLREALLGIQRVLAQAKDPNGVAIVLRAMRGPDNQNSLAKEAATMPIRNDAMGLVAQHFGDVYATSWNQQEIDLSRKTVPHWWESVMAAGCRLGLVEPDYRRY